MTFDIEVRDVEVRYGEHVAIDGMTLKLGGGKIYGLIGRNGSGKSSLLSVIAAFRKASAGEVLVGGQPVFENPLITRQICLIRESGDVAEDESVDHTLKFAADLRPNWDTSYANNLVERFRLPPKKKVKELSRGQRSALGVTLGLATRAPLTIFDESYLGLDAPSRYLFYDELLADFMEQPRTIIISTHLIEEVSRLFEEVIIIDQGKLILHEEAEAVLARGASITGPANEVDQFVNGFRVLNQRQLGPTKSVTIYGQIDDVRQRQARASGLDIGPVALQDLFVYLTKPTGVEHE